MGAHLRMGFRLLPWIALLLPVGACGGGGGDGTGGGQIDTVFTLSVEKFGQGTVAATPGNLDYSAAVARAEYAEGQSVTLTAQPSPGWQLNQWAGGDTVSGNSCTVTMDKSRSVYATFERTTPPVLHDNVRLLTPVEVAEIVTVQDGAIIFSAAASQMASIEDGTVLISTAGEGFARRVVEVVALQGSTTTLRTVDVPLADVLQEGTLVYNDPLTNGAIAQIQSVEGFRYLPAAATSPNITFEVDVELKKEGNRSGRVSGTVELEITPEFALDVGWDGVREFKAVAAIKVKPSLTLSVVEEHGEWEYELTIPAPNITFVTALGPVVLTHVVRTQIRATAKPQVGLSVTGYVEAIARAGAHYLKSTGWRGVGDLSFSGGFDQPALEGNVSADVMVGPVYATRIYGVAGPEIFVGPYLAAEVSYDAVNNCGAWSIKGGARATTTMKGKLLGWQIQSADFTIFDLSSELLGGAFGSGCEDEQPPSAPGDPAVARALPTSLGLSWEAATDNVLVQKYEVYRDFEKIADVGRPVYVDRFLRPDTEYCYYVVAVDAAGNTSSQSGATCASTVVAEDIVSPSTPASLVAKAVSSSSIALDWADSTDDVSDVTYVVYQSGSLAPVATATTSEVTVSRLKTNTEYCFQVVAVDEAGNESSTSDMACATTNAAGSCRMRIKCASASAYAVDTSIELDESITSNVSAVGSATDYDGTPMAYVLTGVYDAVTQRFDGRIDWSFEGEACYRADTFSVGLAGSDSGDVTMSQVSVCGCTAAIRLSRDSVVVDYDDFGDDDIGDWSFDGPAGLDSDPRDAQGRSYPDVMDGVVRGLGSGYDEYGLHATMSREIAMDGSKGFSVALRAVAGAESPNSVQVLLVSSGWGTPAWSGYIFNVYGEGNRRFDLYRKTASGNTLLGTYLLGDDVYAWHTYEISRGASGDWSLAIDNVLQPNTAFAVDTTHAYFDHEALQLHRSGSQCDWIRVARAAAGTGGGGPAGAAQR